MATASVQSSRPLVLLVSSDASLRERLRSSLTGLRWQVLESCGGAEALGLLGHGAAHAILVDSWLPDLEIDEFVAEVSAGYPDVDLISVDGTPMKSVARSTRRGELLHALRECQASGAGTSFSASAAPLPFAVKPATPMNRTSQDEIDTMNGQTIVLDSGPSRSLAGHDSTRLPEFVGAHAALLEVSRRIRLVAPRKTSVLIQGPTGTGKELVARALHRLSPRAGRAFVALNCAAIPEALLEAELFGHARGAFTGAVQRRVGRIEAADGGTLFLDEIGEMPLALQSKLLRFLESGELQRVGENEAVRVDVRVVAATHQPLAARAREGSFRADLFHRLAVFFINTPALAEHPQDIPALAEHFLSQLVRSSPAKIFSRDAMRALEAYVWPGNVRELEHVVERAYILAEDRYEITAAEIEFGEIQ